MIWFKLRMTYIAYMLIGLHYLYVYEVRKTAKGHVYERFRLWHPVTWLLLILAIIPCILFGTKVTEVIPVNWDPKYVRKYLDEPMTLKEHREYCFKKRDEAVEYERRRRIEGEEWNKFNID